MTPQEVAAQFPAFANLLAIPEIANLFASLGPDTTADVFTADLHNTKWWKSHSEAQRTAEALKIGDPAEYRSRVGQTLTQVLNLMAEEGIAGSMSQALTWATNFMNAGYNADQMRQSLVSKAPLDKTLGKIDTVVTQIHGLANDYGVKISNQWAFDNAKKAEATGAGLDEVTASLKNWAAAMFPHLKQQLDEGQTVKQIFDPYGQVAANLLEKSADSFQLTDPRFSKALNTRDADGKTRMMSMEEWQRNLMTDPGYGWDRTMNAQQTAYAMRDQLAQTLGVR